MTALRARVGRAQGHTRRGGARRSCTCAPSASAAATASVRRIDGLREVAGAYQGLLLDQFGVLHDGQRPYPGAVDSVAAAAAAGLHIVIISNSSRRCGGTLTKLARMGFQESWFAGAITSGELTHVHLEQRPGAEWEALGRRCLHITWGRRGAITLAGEGLDDYQVVTDPEQADFVVVHGTEALATPEGGCEEQPLPELMQLLAQCAVRGGVPLICANPDLVTVAGEALIAMPGALARRYQELGGEVRLMGKPAPLIYEAARKLAPGVPPGGWLAVGDSLEHDIAGAQAAGVDALFIAGGIHARDVKLQGSAAEGNARAAWDGGALAQQCALHDVAPMAVAAFMQW